jgi:hypothetical protein
MDCHDVAAKLPSYRSNTVSSLLADIYRAGYVERQETPSEDGPVYEYKLKENVRVG